MMEICLKAGFNLNSMKPWIEDYIGIIYYIKDWIILKIKQFCYK
jgi:hypothetical protein